MKHPASKPTAPTDPAMLSIFSTIVAVKARRVRFIVATIPPKNTEIHSNENPHTPTVLRHRENIGRIGGHVWTLAKHW